MVYRKHGQTWHRVLYNPIGAVLRRGRTRFTQSIPEPAPERNVVHHPPLAEPHLALERAPARARPLPRDTQAELLMGAHNAATDGRQEPKGDAMLGARMIPSRARRCALLTAVTAGLVVPVAPAQGARVSADFFSPSGNIQCEMLHPVVICSTLKPFRRVDMDIHGGLHRCRVKIRCERAHGDVIGNGRHPRGRRKPRRREAFGGGAKGDRTPDLLAASQTLSQLSYGPGCRPRLAWRRADGFCSSAASRSSLAACGGGGSDTSTTAGATATATPTTSGTSFADRPVNATRHDVPDHQRPPSDGHQTAVMSDGTKLAYTLVLPGRLRPRQDVPGAARAAARRPGSGDHRRRRRPGLEGRGEEARLGRRVAGGAGRAVLRAGRRRSTSRSSSRRCTRCSTPEGGKVHLAGVSNGGLSAYRAALDHPDAVLRPADVPGHAAGAVGRRGEAEAPAGGRLGGRARLRLAGGGRGDDREAEVARRRRADHGRAGRDATSWSRSAARSTSTGSSSTARRTDRRAHSARMRRRIPSRGQTPGSLTRTERARVARRGTVRAQDARKRAR